MSNSLKKIIKNVLKIAFAVGIVLYLFKNGKLDFSLVGKAFASKKSWFFCILLLLTQISLSALRWKKLVEIKSHQKLPFTKVLGLTWIGLFFSSVLPGAVTGDFVKLVYARHLDQTLSKTFLLTTILMDRVIGLIGLLCLMGIMSIFTFSEVTDVAPQMKHLLFLNFSLFAGVIIFLVSLFLPKAIQAQILRVTGKIPMISAQINKTLEQVWLIGENTKTVAICFVISTLTQFCSVLALWTVTSPFYGNEVPLGQAFTFMPMGFIAMAIPISPAGLGVGHAIFETLFSFFHVSNGASLFNIYFVNYVCINILGIIPYLLNTSKALPSEINEFTT